MEEKIQESEFQMTEKKWYKFNKEEKQGLAITGIITTLVSVGFYYFIKLAG